MGPRFVCGAGPNEYRRAGATGCESGPVNSGAIRAYRAVEETRRTASAHTRRAAEDTVLRSIQAMAGGSAMDTTAAHRQVACRTVTSISVSSEAAHGPAQNGVSPDAPHCSMYVAAGLLLGTMYQFPSAGRQIAKSVFPSLSKSLATGTSPGTPHCLP
jgi:hypothetical protein